MLRKNWGANTSEAFYLLMLLLSFLLDGCGIISVNPKVRQSFHHCLQTASSVLHVRKWKMLGLLATARCHYKHRFSYLGGLLLLCVKIPDAVLRRPAASQSFLVGPDALALSRFGRSFLMFHRNEKSWIEDLIP
jgi:hypothetical protein